METVGSRYERESVQRYARELRPALPAAVFRRDPARLGWLPVHLAVIAAMAVYVVRAGRRGTSPSWRRWSRVIAGAASGSSRTRRCTMRS